MPAKSVAQRRLMAIALEHPSQLSPRNKGLASLPKSTLKAYASVKESGLPKKVKR